MFPKFANIIKVFGYDWLGRHFAIDSRNGTIFTFGTRHRRSIKYFGKFR